MVSHKKSWLAKLLAAYEASVYQVTTPHPCLLWLGAVLQTRCWISPDCCNRAASREEWIEMCLAEKGSLTFLDSESRCVLLQIMHEGLPCTKFAVSSQSTSLREKGVGKIHSATCLFLPPFLLHVAMERSTRGVFCHPSWLLHRTHSDSGTQQGKWILPPLSAPFNSPCGGYHIATNAGGVKTTLESIRQFITLSQSLEQNSTPLLLLLLCLHSH